MLLESKRRAASVLITVLAILLVLALLPYASGLFAGPVLYVLWLPLHQRMARRIPARLSAAIILGLTLLLVVLPGFGLVTLLIAETQAAVNSVLTGPLLERLEALHVGPIALGPALAQAGNTFFQWLGSNAFAMIGTATRFVLGLLFTLVGLYYLLLNPGTAWQAVAPFIPVTADRAAALRERFHDVTWSTVVGTGLNALVQGTMVGGALAIADVSNAVFWGTVTAVLSILPLVGSGLVWGPAALSLILEGRAGAGIALIAWGLVAVANIDNILRPWVYRRFAHVHPMITLVGAVMGVEYFGLVGLVLGPLAIQYFFELIRMFREEHVQGWWEEGDVSRER
jgi:predicted PurR-regulated permease PerM